MTKLTRQRFALPTGVELDVTLGGPEGAPPVVFLHGFPESSRTWRYQLDDLARDHRVIAPDQRGFARSSKPDGVENYTTDKDDCRCIRAGRCAARRPVYIGRP